MPTLAMVILASRVPLQVCLRATFQKERKKKKGVLFSTEMLKSFNLKRIRVRSKWFCVRPTWRGMQTNWVARHLWSYYHCQIDKN